MYESTYVGLRRPSCVPASEVGEVNREIAFASFARFAHTAHTHAARKQDQRDLEGHICIAGPFFFAGFKYCQAPELTWPGRPNWETVCVCCV